MASITADNYRQEPAIVPISTQNPHYEPQYGMPPFLTLADTVIQQVVRPAPLSARGQG